MGLCSIPYSCTGRERVIPVAGPDGHCLIALSGFPSRTVCDGKALVWATGSLKFLFHKLIVLQAILQEAEFSYDCVILNLYSYPAPTFPLGIAMSNRLSQRLRDQQIEALKIQQQYMTVVRDRHRAWDKDSDDMEINRIRNEILDLVEKTIARYDHLLEALRGPSEGD